MGFTFSMSVFLKFAIILIHINLYICLEGVVIGFQVKISNIHRITN